MLSQRIKKIEESGIRKVFEMASQGGGEYYDFSIGQPHFETPEKLKKALCRATQEDYNRYSPTKGLDDLREKVGEKLKKENEIKAKVDNIMITHGVSGGLFLALASILDSGDEVVLPDPYFVLYKQVLDFLEVKPVFWDTYPDFQLKPETLKKLLNPKTKAIILNTPNNPTGMVYPRKDLELVAGVAREKGIFLISDEIYEKFDFDKKFFSVGSVYDRTITLNGFSKSHLVTGWRVGYAHGPSEVIEAMNKLQQYTFVCAPTPAQKALASTFDFDLSSYIDKYKENRDYLVSNLSSKYALQAPGGGYYAYLKIPRGKENFLEKLKENKILAVPGEVFSRKGGYFRLSLAVDKKTLKQGIEILNRLVK